MSVYQSTTAAGEGEPPRVKKHSGGPAFPRLISLNSDWADDLGMSLRDYFAAQTLQGLAMHHDVPLHEIADLAYAAADAMLLARDK